MGYVIPFRSVFMFSTKGGSMKTCIAATRYRRGHDIRHLRAYDNHDGTQSVVVTNNTGALLKRHHGTPSTIGWTVHDVERRLRRDGWKCDGQSLLEQGVE